MTWCWETCGTSQIHKMQHMCKLLFYIRILHLSPFIWVKICTQTQVFRNKTKHYHMSHFLKSVVTEMIMMARKTNVTDSHVFSRCNILTIMREFDRKKKVYNTQLASAGCGEATNTLLLTTIRCAAFQKMQLLVSR